jgi:hypothetical protein
MDDLVAFLTARLDEREHALRAAGEGRIAWLSYYRDDGHINYTTVAAGGDDADGPDDVWVADGKELPTPKSVLVVHDQARELAEVEAARRRIELHGAEPHECVEYDSNPEWRATCYERDCLTLRLEALPFADHPDYKESWRP